MTAEIVIMNKLGIALAADSAVTVGSGSDGRAPKVFNTVNKLFSLSKYSPVGAMVYGNAELNGIPWEVVIKSYRSELGESSYDTIAQHASAFIDFVGSCDYLCTADCQERKFRSSFLGYLRLVRSDIEKQVKAAIDAHGPIEESEVRKIADTVVARQYSWLISRPVLGEYDRGAKVAQRYFEATEELRHEVFGTLPFSEASMRQIREMGGLLFSRDAFPQEVSGLIIAGYGDRQIYPACVELHTDGVVDDWLKHKEVWRAEIGNDTSAVVRPFAQKEMVHGFMEGVEPDLRSRLDKYLSAVLTEYPTIVSQLLTTNGGCTPEGLDQQLADLGQKVLKDVREDLAEYIRRFHVEPVLQAVASLPKDELSLMAEALVNITSFKRKVSLSAETVGGPIDVAVVSRGDGFIWIKRKHYFQAELNQSFFANYFRHRIREVQDATQEEQ